MNNFVKRTLSGALFVTLVVGSILLSQFTFLVFFALVCGWAVFEFHKITNQQTDIRINVLSAISCAVLLFICSFFKASGLVDTDMAKGEGQFWVASVDKAARQIFDAIKGQKQVVYVTRRWRLIAAILNRIPRIVYNRM